MELTSLLVCVDCKNQMELVNNRLQCSFCGRVYEEEKLVLNAWPSTLGNLERKEAEYHDNADDDPAEIHQLNSWRNRFYHQRILDFLHLRIGNGLVLEVGAGWGLDAASLKDSAFEVVVTDISPGSLQRAVPLSSNKFTYIAVDGKDTPFRSEAFDAAYMIATLHHFSDPKAVIEEMYRVLKPGGYLIIGVEPNAFYFKSIHRFRRFLCRTTHTSENEGSVADAEMIGFSFSDWQELFSQDNWREIQIQPMWLLAGVFHYTAEFLFRALQLRKRIVLPRRFEKVIVQSDENLFRIPLLHQLCWHWIVIARKSTDNFF